MDDLPFPQTKKRILSKGERKKYLREINVDPNVIQRLKQPEKIQQFQVDYTVYKPNLFGKIANAFVGSSAQNIERSFPVFSKNLTHQLRMADIKVLSQTYMNIMVFALLLTFLIAAMGAVFVGHLLGSTLVTSLIIAVGVGLGATVLVGVIFSVYPSTVVSKRSHQIKNDLPFAIIHMSTIAGSGAEPMAMFKLLVNANEYKGLDSDIKRVVNYVNLFGYDISTALKTVATTTPSKQWKDVLTGITTTIESGGSLKSYLKSMAEDTMNSYKLERQKYVETLATYSDIYTAVLIAAPLLFIVTLAIINILGGDIGGFSVSTLAKAGTYIVIPFLNIAFILFLNIINPEK